MSENARKNVSRCARKYVRQNGRLYGQIECQNMPIYGNARHGAHLPVVDLSMKNGPGGLAPRFRSHPSHPSCKRLQGTRVSARNHKETSGTFRTPGPPCGRWSTAVPHHRRFFLQWMCHLSYTVHSSKSKDSKVSFIEVKKFQHDISWFMITKPYKTHQNAKDVEKQHVGWKPQQESNVSGTSAALQISHHFPSDFFSSIAWSLAWSLACHAHSWGITWIRSMCYDVLWECLCCPHLESDDRLSWGKHV